jgi:hypothetical protein
MMNARCAYCNRTLRTVSRISGGGWVVIVIGLCLSPVCVGLVLLPMGMAMRRRSVECPSHGVVASA